MTKICTTIEQSKILIELGLDTKTADMFYWCGTDLRIGGHKAQDKETDVPAWSLSALFENIIKLNNDIPIIESFQLENKKSWTMRYSETNEPFIVFKGDDIIDVVVNLLCWLLKNKKP